MLQLRNLAAVLMLSIAACGTQAPKLAEPPAASSVRSNPTTANAGPAATGGSLVAEANGASVGVFNQPGATNDPRQLANPQPSGAPLVFLVAEEQPEWLKVLLPVRPNGSVGWIRRAQVSTYRHDYRILVELSRFRITVMKGKDVFLAEPIGVGTQDTPTPGGTYYTKELIQPIDDSGRVNPNGPYGPYAYGLSGFSNVLTSFAGGDGVIGIHGTNDPSTIGRNVSHGCIRMSNAGITKLAKVLPLGIPVEIRA